LNVHKDPVESLENTNDVFAVGLLVEPHGFKKLVPFVILYGECFVASIVYPLESIGFPFTSLPDG